MANAFNTTVKNEAIARGYNIDDSWLQTPLRRCVAQIVKISEKQHFIAVSCETSDRLLLYSLGQKLSLLKSLQIESPVSSFHLTSKYLAMATKTTVSIFKLSPDQIRLKIVIPTTKQAASVIVTDDNENVKLLVSTKKETLDVYETIASPFCLPNTICDKVRVSIFI